MDNCNSRTDFFVVLLRSADRSLLISLMLVCWRILASLRAFSRRDLTPRSFQELEIRLERLGLIDDRVSPALAHKLGRLAADLPQQPAIEQLAEQFDVRLSVDTYRKVVESLSYQVRYLHSKHQVRWQSNFVM